MARNKSRFWIGVALTIATTAAMVPINQVADAIPKTSAGSGAEVHKVKPLGYKPAEESPESKAGKQVFEKNHCVQCHSMGTKGGCLGPVLAGVGARRSKKFIEDRVTAGAENEFAALYGHAELMPHPRLPKKMAEQVVSYLMTLPEPKDGFAIKGHVADAKDSLPEQDTEKPSVKSIQMGKKLFYSKGCMSCHSIFKVGGQFATALDDVGSRRGRRYISARITGAELLTLGEGGEYDERGTVMPPSNLTPAQIKAITDYLMSLSSVKSP